MILINDGCGTSFNFNEPRASGMAMDAPRQVYKKHAIVPLGTLAI